MWLLLLFACLEPKETGPSGMVGVLRDHAGMPLEGIPVESLEARDITDESGHFAVVYKDPEQYVHFRYGGAFYQRRYAPADAGKVLELGLAPTRDVELRCEVACEAELVWQLPSGLVARAGTPCEPGRPVGLASVPTPTPEVLCRAGGAPVEVVVEDAVRVLRVAPPPTPVRIEIVSTDTPPKVCQVLVGARLARPSGDGFYVGEASGPVAVSASCDGRSALPVGVTRGQESASVEWSPTGPDLDLAGVAPDAQMIVVVSEGAGGWMLRVPAADGGRFALPPLPAGTYRVAVGDASLLVGSDPPPAEEPGVLRLVPVQGFDTSGLYGSLRLDADLDDGAIAVRAP